VSIAIRVLSIAASAFLFQGPEPLPVVLDRHAQNLFRVLTFTAPLLQPNKNPLGRFVGERLFDSLAHLLK
jgi:hypothetical protein